MPQRSTVRAAFRSLGSFAIHGLKTARSAAAGRVPHGEALRQLDRVGVRSLTLVNLCAIFIGMVLTLQVAHELTRFGSKEYIGQIVGVAFLREIGPVFTAIMLAGRVGTGMAAELGSMAVTEQIDAMRAMGADPYGKLVVPRVVALTVMAPLLTLLADLLGVVSGLVIGVLGLGMGLSQYATTVRGMELFDLLSGLSKAAVFGLLISLIATFYGLRAAGGTEGVGRSTTRAMVTSVYAIVVGDFLLTKILLGFASVSQRPAVYVALGP